VSFAAITLCVASQRVFIVVIVYFVMTLSGKFWIHHSLAVVSSVSACQLVLLRDICTLVLRTSKILKYVL
jgi:hypothetical protein